MAFAAVFIGFIALVLSRWDDLAPRVIPWMFGGLGVVGFLLGLMLLIDFHGSAHAYADMMKKYKPFGVDYSRSPFSRSAFLRFFGAAYMVIGLWFIVLSTLFASGVRV
ncbi:hypothetical protein AB6813_22090 [bacterium RCC_150]